MDKKAKRILMSTYWSSKGWKDENVTAPDDFAYAKEKGLMFDSFTISHDEGVRRIVEIVNSITQEQVVKAFLSSLSTRRLDWRSGICSYSIAKMFSVHQYKPKVSGYLIVDGEKVPTTCVCEICDNVKYGIIGLESYEDEDLNVLNFKRIKWGGTNHGDLLYILFDLEQFVKAQISDPTEADVEIFKGILNAINSCDPEDYPSALRDKLKDVPGLKSNKAERATILEILACIGVLQPKSYDRPIAGRNDWTFVEYWRGEDGYDKATVETYFGRYLK